MLGPQFWTVGKSRMKIQNSYLLKFYLIYLNLKNFTHLEKDLTKVSTNCVVITFFVNELSQVSSFKRKADIIFQDYLIKEFLRSTALSLFLVEKLQRYNTLFGAQRRCLG